jgi:hypothetical protein
MPTRERGFSILAIKNFVLALKTQKDLTFTLAGEYDGGGGATVVTFNDR